MVKSQFKPINVKSFHAKTHANKHWKTRSADAKAIYDMIVTLGSELYENGFFHPKMTPESLPPRHFETVVHNIGWLVADEIILEQKKYKEEIRPTTIKKIVKKQNKATNKSTKSMAKKKSLPKK